MGLKQLVGWLLAIGALVWLIVGLAGVNVVESIFGAGSMLARLIYIVIGLAGLYKVGMLLGVVGKK